MIYRDRLAHEMSKDEKRDRMLSIIAAGTPVGLLAYEDGEPAGWCSVAPRETFPKLQRSKAMPTGDLQPAWNVTCFFVRRRLRGAGVTRELLRAAVDYARENGAAALEGYPWDTSRNHSRFKGHSSVFRQLGFRQDGTRWHLSLRGGELGD
jgi:GNAT superfamily N-acetyltransferase